MTVATTGLMILANDTTSGGGRRVLVYATHTGTWDITGRMESMLTRHGFPGGGDEGRCR